MKIQNPRLMTWILACAVCTTCAAPNTTDNGFDGPAPSDGFMTRVIPLSKDYEPQWDQPAPLHERMEHYKVPGVGIAVIDNFEIVWAEGHGSLRAGDDVLVDVETLFHAGSVAKPVATAAILHLVEAGVLDLDSDVNATLTSWRIPDNELTVAEKVTLRRLLSHSAGIEDGITNRSSTDKLPNYLSPAGIKPTTSIHEILEAGPGIDADGPARVTAVPGSRYRYANADFAIVELVARDATGVPFDDFMQTTVLDPLGMTSSTFHQPLPVDLRARAAIEHDFKGRPIEGDRLHIPLLAAGGLWTTPADLAGFALEIMNAYRGESGRILSQQTARLMLAPEIAISGNPLADTMALGFERSGEGPEFSILHTGGTWGSTAVLLAYPEVGKGAVVMTNSATGSLLRFEILLALSAEYGWPLSS